VFWTISRENVPKCTLKNVTHGETWASQNLFPLVDEISGNKIRGRGDKKDDIHAALHHFYGRVLREVTL
jgi:hypothetical protein